MVSYQLSNGTRHTHRSPQMPHVQSTSQHHFPRTKTMPKIILHIWMTKIFSTKSSSWTGTKCHHHFCMTDKRYTGLAVIWCKSELYGSGCIRLAWKKYTRTTLHLNCRSMQVVWQSYFAVLMFYPSCHREDEQNIPAWAKRMPLFPSSKPMANLKVISVGPDSGSHSLCYYKELWRHFCCLFLGQLLHLKHYKNSGLKGWYGELHI